MRTLIHIGQHKTGTTSIQHYLQANRKGLLAQGLYVAERLCGVDRPSHYLLNVYALDESRSSPAKDILLSAKSPEIFRQLPGRLHADVSEHYRLAREHGCKDVLWTNEGLYLLNSVSEYQRLIRLFSPYSDEVVAVCCFRPVDAFRESYRKELLCNPAVTPVTTDSYRNITEDSWLFDEERKKMLLGQTFDRVIGFAFRPDDMVKEFMTRIGYDAPDSTAFRLNVTLG